MTVKELVDLLMLKDQTLPVRAVWRCCEWTENCPDMHAGDVIDVALAVNPAGVDILLDS